MQPQTNAILKVAAKAVIVNDQGQVLLLREAATGKDTTQVGLWGLVGGRLEPGEAFLEGLAREVMEETGLHVEVKRPLYVGEWHPVIRGVPHQIIAIFMLCHSTATEIQLSDEHDAYEWVDPAKRTAYSMMKPDDLVVDELTRQ